MILAYLDESAGYDQHYVTALVVNNQSIQLIENGLKGIVSHIQNNIGQVPTAIEFHASQFTFGKGDWAVFRNNIPAVIDVTKRLATSIASSGASIQVRGIQMSGFFRKYGISANIHSAALTFILERIEWRAREQQEFALVISDEVSHGPIYRAELAYYKDYSTWGWRAMRLDNIIDTMHFAPSHASRLLQAADFVSYAHFQTMRPHNDPRTSQFWSDVWQIMLPAVKEASIWTPP